jgi:hypothetical protein
MCLKGAIKIVPLLVMYNGVLTMAMRAIFIKLLLVLCYTQGWCSKKFIGIGRIVSIHPFGLQTKSRYGYYKCRSTESGSF